MGAIFRRFSVWCPWFCLPCCISASNINGMKQRLLAVDDEPHMLRLLERIVTEKTRYEITTTSNSLKVPEILGDESFDLIITDLRMPGMDGMDILRYVREENREELVVIITAFGTLESAREALSAGAFDYITKPFRKEEIVQAIGRVMDWQFCRREARRLTAIVDREPYKAALSAFEVEYVRRLRERVGGDVEALAERSGLPREKIRAILQERD